jgi:hypothetical protein
LTSAPPLLPQALTLRLAVPLAWAIVLGAATLFLGRRLPRAWRIGLAVAVALWALVQGPASPTYWLGLAFQIPSFTTILICLACLVSCSRSEGELKPSQGHSGRVLSWAGVALGWLLLLDTLALLPFFLSVYHWGFSPAALAVAAALVCGYWALAGGASGPDHSPVLLAAALLLFVLLRLPTGNLFDALIDPWLWVFLQISVLRRVWQRATRG